jgi:hypothetical protein
MIIALSRALAWERVADRPGEGAFFPYAIALPTRKREKSQLFQPLALHPAAQAFIRG